MSRFCKFGKLHVTKGNVDKLLGILLTASKELKRSLDSRIVIIGDPLRLKLLHWWKCWWSC